MDECVSLAREAMVEFPGDERIMLCLASVLYQAGYVRHGEHHLIDSDGYSVYDVQRHRAYTEWREAITLYEKALSTIDDPQLRRQATQELSQLYVNVGAYDKALSLADAAPDIRGSRAFLRINACDGKKQAAAYGEALLSTTRACAELMVHAILVNQRHLTPTEKRLALENVLRLFECLCPDHHFGEHHAFAGKLHMLRSAYLWLEGRRDDAFAALDETLNHIRAYEALAKKGVCAYTAPLIQLVKTNIPPLPCPITANLPEDWPWWHIPEGEAIKAEMSADPRWHAWVAKTQA